MPPISEKERKKLLADFDKSDDDDDLFNPDVGLRRTQRLPESSLEPPSQVPTSTSSTETQVAGAVATNDSKEKFEERGKKAQ
jgi:hypothetical protein